MQDKYFCLKRSSSGIFSVLSPEVAKVLRRALRPYQDEAIISCVTILGVPKVNECATFAGYFFFSYYLPLKLFNCKSSLKARNRDITSVDMSCIIKIALCFFSGKNKSYWHGNLLALVVLNENKWMFAYK